MKEKITFFTKKGKRKTKTFKTKVEMEKFVKSHGIDEYDHAGMRYLHI